MHFCTIMRQDALRPVVKLLLLMKLTFIFFIAMMLQLSARESSAQTISLNGRKASLVEIFRAIRYQTGYDFFYSQGLIDQTKAVAIRVKDAPLEQVLDACLHGQNLSYTIKDKIIIIKAKTPEQIALDALAQIDVRGRVVDSLGHPLKGATVRIKGTARTVMTGSNGEFALRGVDEEAVLVVSFVGYVTQDIRAARDIGDIVLIAIPNVLDEVIVNKGYYTISQRLNTGSVAQVTGESIAKQPVSNPLQALQGRVSGLVINHTNGIVPGGEMNVKIRGTSSIASGTSPLYIVDGVPYPSGSLSPQGRSDQLSFTLTSPFNSINPQDIESIEVLKDADATSLYGSRGANGVILITTKRGKAGRTSVDANFYGGFGRVTRRLDVLGLEESLEIRREAFANDGITPTVSNAPDLMVWDNTSSTDFQKMLMGETAPLYDANVSLRGGNDQTQFLISGGYRKQDVVSPGDDLGLNRANARLSLDHNLLKNRLKLNANVLFTDEKNVFLPDNFIHQLFFPPNYPLYDDQGKPFFLDNTGTYANAPVGTLMERSKNYSQNLTGNVTANLEILDGLSFRNSLGYTQIQTRQNNLFPSASQNPSGETANGSATFGNGGIETFIVEPQFNYQRKFSKGNLMALVGGTYQQSNSINHAITGTNFISDDLIEDIRSAATIAVSTNLTTEYKYASVFSRVGYTWDEKYIINLNYRRDASSRFGPGRRIGNFGAASVGWIFSEEEVMKDRFSFVSFGKLRASYGTSGNDQIADYGYLSNYGTSTPFLSATLRPLRIANPEYSWETNKKLELGLELNFFNDRVRLISNYFRNLSGNQLVNMPLPGQVGFTSYTANLPAEVENKGWEFDLSSDVIIARDFKWTASLNLTAPSNKLLSFPGIENTTYANTYIVGRPLDLIALLKFQGVDPATGLPQIEDYNQDGVISDMINGGDRQYVGKTYADYYGGLSNELRYKNFNLSFLIQFSSGNKNTNPQFYSGARIAGELGNTLGFTRNRWKVPGDLTDVPIASSTVNTQIEQNFISSTGNRLSDASYIRLTNLYLGYDITSGKIRGWSVYITGQNIFTITSYQGLDPETGPMFMPPLQVLTCGVKFTL